MSNHRMHAWGSPTRPPTFKDALDRVALDVIEGGKDQSIERGLAIRAHLLRFARMTVLYAGKEDGLELLEVIDGLEEGAANDRRREQWEREQ